MGAPLSACQEFRPSSKIPTTSDHGSKIRPLPTTAQKSDHFRPRFKNPTTSDHASKFRPIPTTLQNSDHFRPPEFRAGVKIASRVPGDPRDAALCGWGRFARALPRRLGSAVSGSEMVGFVIRALFQPLPPPFESTIAAAAVYVDSKGGGQRKKHKKQDTDETLEISPVAQLHAQLHEASLIKCSQLHSCTVALVL